MQPIAFHAVNAITIIISHFDYIDQTVNVRELLHNSDISLFTKTCLLGRCLYHLLPPQRICTNLRSRGHNLQLPSVPDYCSALHKRSFVIRTLFESVYFF